MSQAQAVSFSFDGLDRGVVLATVSGLIVNGADASLLGMLFTLAAALIYALSRNRIANLDDFECVLVAGPSGIDLVRFTRLCQWLGSRRLHDGLLEEFVDSESGSTPEAARQYIRTHLWPALWEHSTDKIRTLFWLDSSC